MALAELIMPKMGESIMEATILKWHKQVGDFVKKDEIILDIATDKVDSEIPSTFEGVIKDIKFSVNDVVPVGGVLALIETAVDASSAVTAPQNPVVAQPQTTPTANTTVVEPVAETIPYTPTSSIPQNLPSNNKFYSPLVLNIANSEGVSLSELEKITGTGAEGRVTKRDVLQYIADKKAGKQISQPAPSASPILPEVTASPIQPAEPVAAASTPTAVSNIYTEAPSNNQFNPIHSNLASSDVEIVEMDRMRKLIAKHMVDSVHTSPHVTSFVEADVTNMVKWRDSMKQDFEKREGIKLTFTPMFLECIVKALHKFPIINSSVDGDKILIKKYFNIGMATALPNGNLIVPVIKNAENLSLVSLTREVNSLADKARTNKLKPDDTQGGTFTFTNVGTFGSLMGTPIINQPQSAILAVGTIKKRPVVIETEQGDFVGIRHMMYLSLSYDHRIIDGAQGASFLSEVAKQMEAWDVNRQLKYVVKELYVE